MGVVGGGSDLLLQEYWETIITPILFFFKTFSRLKKDPVSLRLSWAAASLEMNKMFKKKSKIVKELLQYWILKLVIIELFLFLNLQAKHGLVIS